MNCVYKHFFGFFIVVGVVCCLFKGVFVVVEDSFRTEDYLFPSFLFDIISEGVVVKFFEATVIEKVASVVYKGHFAFAVFASAG